MQVTQPLSDGERLRFEQCREVIRANLKTCFEVGKALAEIRDKTLYREHWKTFEAFCSAEFSIGKSHAYRLIDAAEVKATVEKSPNGGRIDSERHARELKNVPVELRSAVLEEAAKSGDVTAESIATAAKKVVPPPEPPKPVIELDATGFPIPEKLVELWKRTPEVRELLRAVSLLRTRLRKAQEEADILFEPIAGKGHEQTWTGLISSLDKAYASIGLAVPYAVCPVCQGRLAANCAACHGRGFVSEFFYNSALDSDSRKVREAACKQRKDK